MSTSIFFRLSGIEDIESKTDFLSLDAKKTRGVGTLNNSAPLVIVDGIDICFIKKPKAYQVN